MHLVYLTAALPLRFSLVCDVYFMQTWRKTEGNIYDIIAYYPNKTYSDLRPIKS